VAQTEFEIKTSNSNLQQEFKEELDTWMLRAYEGDREAQFKVGVLFTNDQFSPPDYEQAVYWYKQAARQGHVFAQYNLGHQYLRGIGVLKNERTAMQWWTEAAEQDHQLAQFNLGRAHYLGIGVDENHALSKYWFERAAFNKEPKSIEILQQLGWYDGEVTELPKFPKINKQQNIATESDTDNPVQTTTFTSKVTPIADPKGAAQSASSVVAQGNTQQDSDPAELEQYIPAAGSDSSPSEPNLIAEEEPETPIIEISPESQIEAEVVVKNPLALYTNPKVRSVLIAIIDERDTISVTNPGNSWSTVRSSVGFPVWVRGDFLRVEGKRGTIKGQAVNARSVPIVTNGTVVGKLKRGEKVKVLEKRNEWYRIVAPTRFNAWAKTTDLKRGQTVKRRTKPSGWVSSQIKKPVKQATGSKFVGNDNAWLFSQLPANYTLQLASFDDADKVIEFLSRAKFKNNPELHRFVSGGTNIKWTYFLYGSYAEKNIAEAAKKSIKQKLAWVRSFGRLQQNRCVAWKTQLPTPKELNQYCSK
jgi:septal ring-binding cell division protein DamX